MLGASFDDPATNKRFADKHLFTFSLLSDVDQVIGTSYGVVRPADHKWAAMPRRVTFLIDPRKVVRRVYAAYRHKSWTWPARSPGSSDAHQVRVLRTQVDEHCDREADRLERDETDIGPGAATSAAWACERKIVGIIL